MDHYQQSPMIEAGPATVYATLPTIDGPRGRWTEDRDGAPQAGDRLDFHFGRSDKEMRIERLEPRREVCWLCYGGALDD